MKLTYDEVIERLNNERSVDRDEVKKSALLRKVWVAAWGLPGCLYENRAICRTKTDAIRAALFMAESENGPPRGMWTALFKYGHFQIYSPIYGHLDNVIYQETLGEML
jgi:hypothetical protein